MPKKAKEKKPRCEMLRDKSYRRCGNVVAFTTPTGYPICRKHRDKLLVSIEDRYPDVIWYLRERGILDPSDR